MASLPVERPDEPAAVEHTDPVGERQDLVEFGRDEQDRGSPVAEFDDLLVDELDRPDVEAAGRLGDDEHLDVAGQLAGDDHLLLVAARERFDGHLDPRCPHVELVDENGRLVVDRLRVADAAT